MGKKFDKDSLAADLSNYASKKELEHMTGVHASDFAATEDFIAFKAEFDKLDIAKLVVLELVWIF